MDEKALRKLREKADKALAANRDDVAIPLLAELVRAEPTNARWPHKLGDLLRRNGRTADAVQAYTTAVDTYARTGFIARAIAMAKTVLSLDPSRVDVLTRVDPNAAQALHRQARPASLLPAAAARTATQPGAARTVTQPGRVHAAVLPDDAPEMRPTKQGRPRTATLKGSVQRHPMVLDDEASEAAEGAASQHRHPMVLEDDVGEATASQHRHPMVLLDDDAAEPSPPLSDHPIVVDEDEAAAPPPSDHPIVLEDDAPAEPAAPPASAARKPPPRAAAPQTIPLDDELFAAPPSRPKAPQPRAAPATVPLDDELFAVASAPPNRPPSGPMAVPPPPPPAAAMRARPAPPPPRSAAQPARPITLDQLSLPPPAPPPPPPARPTRQGWPEGSKRGAQGGPRLSPPQPAGAAKAAAPAPPAAISRESDAPLWADHSPVGGLPQGPADSPRNPGRPPSGPLKLRPYEPPADEAELFSRALEAAVELDIAPDVEPNETRFSNAPPSAALELSTEELSPRTQVAIEESADAVPQSAGQLSHLPLFPLFAEVPQDVLAEMVEGTELIELRDGDYVVRRGDPADALYGIVEGSVAVIMPNQTLELTLAEGDVFGESCFLKDEPRHADVRVKGRLTALRIPRETLTKMLRRCPQLAEVLLDLLTRRLLGNLLQTSPLFQEFDAEGRRELSRLFEVRRASEGTKLAIAGKKMDALYVSLTGTLLIETPGQQPRIVAPGSMFGQHTLLSRGPSPSTVTARVNLVVLRLPNATFSRMAMQYPTVLDRLAEMATSDVVSITV